MSEHILNQDLRLNDSSERSTIRNAQADGESVSAVASSKNIFIFLKRKLVTFANFMVELSEEINRVRAESEKYSRSHW